MGEEEEADQEPDQVRVKPGSLGPNILTFQLETGRGARCISNGAKELTSVANQPHVHGRMFTPQSQPTNETGTSSGRPGPARRMWRNIRCQRCIDSRTFSIGLARKEKG